MSSETLIRVIQYELKDKEFINNEISELSKPDRKDLHDKLNDLITHTRDNLFEAQRGMRSYRKQKEKHELFKRVVLALETNISDYHEYLKMTA